MSFFLLAWELLRFGSGVARADAEPISLVYNVESGCPARADFLAQVVGRTTKAEFREGQATRRTFTITASEAVGGARGRLVIEDGDTRAVREISAQSCAEVVSALALFTTLAIDPYAKVDNSASVGGEKHVTEPTAPTSGNDGVDKARQVPAPLQASESSPWRWTTGIDAQGRLGASPGPAYGGLAFVEAAHGRDVLSWSGHLALSVAENGEQPAKVRMLTAVLDECPLTLGGGKTLGALTCVGIEVGWITARATSGTGNARPLSQANQRWTSVHLVERFRWSLRAPFFLEAAGGVDVPLARYDFLVMAAVPGGPDRPVYSMRSVGFMGGLGLGIHIP